MELQLLIATLTCAMIVLSEGSSITVSPSTATQSRNWTISKTGDTTMEPVLQNVKNICFEEYYNYCINGLCTFHKQLNLPICRCLSGYTGERCEHMVLSSYKSDDQVTYVAIGIGFGLLLSGIIGFVWCYMDKRCTKSKSTYEMCSEERAL
ncbi:epigen [Ascaphus truei]|uniref:epigen n=1 Tax=Ascaphus truei TaxID=8439 RepID=UPI003F5A52BF